MTNQIGHYYWGDDSIKTVLVSPLLGNYHE